MKTLIIAMSALSLLAGSAANAAVCRDAKGHFIKCPQHAVAKAKKCRDAKGHFAKCGTKGAKPV